MWMGNGIVTPSGKSLSCKSHLRHGYIVAVTGSMWLLRGLYGSYRVYVLLFFYENPLAWFSREWFTCTWRCDHGINIFWFCFVMCVTSAQRHDLWPNTIFCLQVLTHRRSWWLVGRCACGESMWTQPISSREHGEWGVIFWCTRTVDVVTSHKLAFPRANLCKLLPNKHWCFHTHMRCYFFCIVVAF